MAESDRRLLPTLARPRLVAAFLAGCVGCTCAGLLLGGVVRSPREITARPATVAGPVYAEASERVVAPVFSVPGTVDGQRQVTVPAPDVEAGQRAVVTDVPVRVGDVVRSGELLGEVAGRPVIALRLSVPMYRSLHRGAHGDDVREVQRALRVLGHYRRPVTGVFDRSTEAAVARLYRSLDQEPPIEDAPTDVLPTRDSPTKESLTRDSPTKESPTRESPTRESPTKERPAPATAARSTTTVTGPLGARQAAAAAPARRGWLPLDEIFALSDESAVVAALAVRGSVLSGAQATLATLRLGRVVVRARVPVDAVDEFRRGARIRVAAAGVDLDTDAADRVADGRVVAVSAFRAGADEAPIGGTGGTTGSDPSDRSGDADGSGTGSGTGSGADGSVRTDLPGYDITVTFDGSPPPWARTGLEVVVRESGTAAAKTLAVPLIAVRQGTGGTYVLKAGAGGRVVEVPVRVRADAAGWAAVEAETLAVGDRVQIAP